MRSSRSFWSEFWNLAAEPLMKQCIPCFLFPRLLTHCLWVISQQRLMQFGGTVRWIEQRIENNCMPSACHVIVGCNMKKGSGYQTHAETQKQVFLSLEAEAVAQSNDESTHRLFSLSLFFFLSFFFIVRLYMSLYCIQKINAYNYFRWKWIKSEWDREEQVIKPKSDSKKEGANHALVVQLTYRSFSLSSSLRDGLPYWVMKGFCHSVPTRLQPLHTFLKWFSLEVTASQPVRLWFPSWVRRRQVVLPSQNGHIYPSLFLGRRSSFFFRLALSPHRQLDLVDEDTRSQHWVANKAVECQCYRISKCKCIKGSWGWERK